MDKSFRFSLIKVDATSKDASIFLSGFSFTNIHDLQDSGGRVTSFLELLSTTSTGFIDT